LNGRVASLLEVGTGFHPELTGRENIFLNGAILGMRRREIQRKFDEIVAFAEIERFLDTPVKRYSSGMYTRLAFAVAAHLDPEILLVDEVLAVGDAAFQKKCLGKMEDVSKAGRTVLFVSHNMGAVARLCQRVLWFEQGRCIEQGPAASVVSTYLTSSARDGECLWPEGVSGSGIDEFKVLGIAIRRPDGAISSTVDATAPIQIEVSYRIVKPTEACRVGVMISTYDGVEVLESYDADHEEWTGPREPGDYVGICTVPANLLNPGRYLLSINAGIPFRRNFAFLEGVLRLSVQDSESSNPFDHVQRHGVIRPRFDWACQQIAPGATGRRVHDEGRVLVGEFS
jgi:lipopolysaccharide transport system ATP-binding protein